MNGYKTRSPHEHSNHHSSEPTSMTTCYENTANSEIPYNHSSGSYNVLQPFNSYPPSYFEPQASMTLQPPEMNPIPPLRHDQQHHFNQYSLRHPGYMGPSGYPPPEAPRFTTSTNGGGFTESEVESQDSINETTMLSEPISPPLDGFPHVEEFNKLMESYVNDLSVKKQDKALINARRARNIRKVLTDPKDTAVGSAQFRFWVKKMFKLEPADSRLPMARKWICHEGKPVAIREKLFKILTRAHQQCQHGGRDKTSSQVRQIYSWVPKELISRFVKICPTCQVRRGGAHLSPPDSRRNSPPMELSRAQQQQQQQSPLAYMRVQPTSPISIYDEYRRNSSSSYVYSDRSRESATWAYPSPGSRNGEMTYNAASASHPHAQPHHHHHQHHQHQHRQHHADSGGSSSSNGRHLSSSSTSSSHTMKRSNMHVDASLPPSPASEQSSPSQTLSQSQYGYMPGAHANSRYRSGY
ncbi:hypothetical protein UA08_05818 [Talaromyces atroroseus]|uniref:Integrase zinc-binding domain-containing protein n=1 Tax=Talaromyces atroroseus TaxID=1441469 RepID=A0A225ANE9_TALAT|nr:hypothetical protein UA08_05818 [Talaromyces atroroseus]OKL58818.1 hypothetical protein UA08_05818 [Talaromyces atroroseus]